MASEFPEEASEIFVQACEVEPRDLDAFLQSACADDGELRRRVEVLLAADRKLPGSFLQQPALQVAADMLAEDQQNSLPVTGTTIGNYRIGEKIGAGGMGTVYAAVDQRLNRPVAIKLLPPMYTSDPERVRRFSQEARAASLLNHPNIVSIYDADRDPATGQHFIATELVEGKTLRQLANSGELDNKSLVDITIQIASALGAAHNAGIVHRDIKPENVMLRPDGIVKVLDFGLAKLLDRSNSDPSIQTLDTRPGNLVGTTHYLSPEQVVGKPANAANDLFSLGVVLYELATGVRPFEGPTDGAIFDAILHHIPPPPREIKPGISPELERTILRLIEKDPELRFQTASDLRASLRRIDRDSQLTRSVDTIAWAKRSNVAKWIATGAGLLVLGGAIVWAFGPNRIRREPLPVSFERLTDDPGEEILPSLSPDGKQFVYASPRAGHWDIYLQRTGGSTAINLTKDFPGENTQPAFSHDGSRIAFRSDRFGGGIFVMELTGENPRRVSSRGYYPAWSPDDREIVYEEHSFTYPSRRSFPGTQLSVVNVANGSERALHGPEDAVQPSWSPHGYRIAYWGIKVHGGQRDIYTMPADGNGPPVAVTQDQALDWNPVWAPSGKELYFLSDRGGSMNLWRVATDERTGRTHGEPEAVTLPSKYVRHVSFAADGKTFAFVDSLQQVSLYMANFDMVKLAFTGKPAQIGGNATSIGGFALSPDESRIVYDNLGDHQEDVWVMDADGTHHRRLTNDFALDRDPSWSPDGSQIVFYSDRAKPRYNVWSIRDDGSGLRQLTNFGPEYECQTPVWTHDGKRIIVSLQGRWPGWIEPNAEKQTEPPTPLPRIGPPSKGLVYFPPWNRPLNPSEDDRWIGEDRSEGESEIIVYSISTSKFERTGVFGINPVWLPGQKYFFFARGDKILLYNIARKSESVLLALAPSEPWTMHATRDGSRIYFSQTIKEGDVWIGRMGGK